MAKMFVEKDKQLQVQGDTLIHSSGVSETPSSLSNTALLRVAEVVHERNLKPSERPKESDLRAFAASRRLNIPHWTPIIIDLIYWRKPSVTFAVFFAAMTLQLGLLMCSVISVLSNFFLALLVCSACTRGYFRLIAAPQRNPITSIEKLDLRLAPTASSEVVQILTSKVNNAIHIIRDLFLLKNIGESLRFAAALYSLTYIGAHFNFSTICIFGTICAFLGPKLHEMYKVEINDLMKRSICEAKKMCNRICQKILGMLPAAQNRMKI